ncbi:PREDICTED: probable GPI-anchored adhesin-like protein PGA55 [Vollenhovia emeryi]|uniref:probable GPI-anchored adhesin-like protein PGA55 n=1 Tax=Vollenhovia emeryi TaxID=411798 RepID=UPI0005F39D51|nr:PREDICTED: probable GPI-anchored adhesin-like protein PGA55 [Vollenhovia emeryi]
MIPATMNTLKLDLERKKKSEERSFLSSYDSLSSSSSSSPPSSSSSSSSEDEQLAGDEENERTRQKGGEESDGRRPMAEQERKVSDGNNGELLLPWKVEVRDEIQPRTLIEEISESKQQYTTDDVGRKSHEEQILNNCKNIHDPRSSDCMLDRKTADYRKVILKSQMEKEKTADPEKSINDNNETNDHKNERISTCSVSCDTSDLKQTLEEDKFANTVINMRDDTSSKNNKSYHRKSKEYPFGSKLSSIREEMREFCDSMDRFVDENRIVFKNGEVEGFWGERKMVDENLQTDFVDDRKIQETGIKVSASEEDKLRWWSIKERKLKVKETLKKREDEAEKNKVEVEDTEKFDCCSSQDRKQPIDTTNNFQDIYDMVTLKTYPSSVLPDSTEVYSIKDAENYDCEKPIKRQEQSGGVFSSLFAELRNRDCVQKIHKPKVSAELMVLEERSDYEKTAIDTKNKSVSTLINMEGLVDCNEQHLNETIAEEDNSSPKIEILEDKVNHFSVESYEGKRNIDESDDDSFKTATSIQEDLQVSEGNYEPSEVLINMENNCNKITDSIKVDNQWKEIILNKEHNDVICEDEKINNKSEKCDTIEISKQEFSTEQSNSQRKSLVRTMDRFSLERTSHSSKLTGKRIREAEDIEVSNKKSFLIEEINPGKKPEERKSRNQISERCRQHLIQETKKFARKVSPLIDKCITNLIKETEDAGEKLQCHKYYNPSLEEHLPFGCVSKMNLSKLAGNFGDNCDNKSNDMTNVYPEKQELLTEQTINSQSAVSASHSDIQSLANLLRQSEDCKSESPAMNANVSFYKEFCDHLHELESRKKLLIKPDFVMDNQESKEILPDNKLLKKPLIEVISKCSTTSEEQTCEQKGIEEQSHTNSQTISQQTDAVFKKSEETVEISDDFENCINQESAVNSKEEIKIVTLCTAVNTECKEERVLPNEERKTVTTNMKKSIEMQVAQDNYNRIN